MIAQISGHKPLKPLYFDMDGVLANFDAEPNAKIRFLTERGFFARLKPLIRNVQVVDMLSRRNPNSVYIITKSPHKAEGDKRLWLARWLPNIEPSHIIMVRLYENKTDKMQTENGILFDDWEKNILQWKSKVGNAAYQVKADGDLVKLLKGTF